MEDPIVQHAYDTVINALLDNLPKNQRNMKNAKAVLEKMERNGDIFPILTRALPHDTEQLLAFYARNPHVAKYADDVIYDFQDQDTTGFDMELNLNFYLFSGLRNYVLDVIEEHLDKSIREEQER